MGSLNKKSLFEKQVIKMEKIIVNEEGDYVFVKEMSAKERAWYESQIIHYGTDDNGKMKVTQTMDRYKTKLAISTICDSKGVLLFTMDDMDLIETLNGNLIQEVIEVASRLNKMDEKALETEVKNSEAAPGGASSSDSV
jgi:hypothetical protein